MIDSTAPHLLPAYISRLDNIHIFKTDKTYWLVRLSGYLVISLCDWMIERGARLVAITSRNPKINLAWIRD